MTTISAKFMSLVQQYEALQVRHNRDYTPQIAALARSEMTAMEARGIPATEARAIITRSLAALVKRFPPPNEF